MAKGHLIDLTGTRFGDVVVVDRAPNRGAYTMWNCQCDCGSTIVAYAHNLRSKSTYSCGCKSPNRMYKSVDLTGRTFGLLTVKKRCDYGHAKWVCDCQCGKQVDVRAGDLLLWQQSCGCLVNRHDMSHTPIYQIWGAMIQRCCNSRSRSYLDYGGRGIRVCDRWRDFSLFFADMGHRPGEMSLERIDNSGPYSPENCRWATSIEQGNNKRNNRRMTINNEEMTVAQASRKFGVPDKTIRQRLRYGWSDRESATTRVLPFGTRRSHLATA